MNFKQKPSLDTKINSTKAKPKALLAASQATSLRRVRARNSRERRVSASLVLFIKRQTNKLYAVVEVYISSSQYFHHHHLLYVVVVVETIVVLLQTSNETNNFSRPKSIK